MSRQGGTVLTPLTRPPTGFAPTGSAPKTVSPASLPSDSGFGSITSVHDNVLATTCSVPQSVDATPYECTFDAYFYGGSHTNTVTATAGDNDGNTTQPTSSSLTVNVGATTP